MGSVTVKVSAAADDGYETDDSFALLVNRDWVFVAQWGSLGTGNGQFNLPRGIAVAADGSVYVADTYNHRVQKFDTNGAFVAKWGSSGTGDGQFNLPVGIAVDADGSVYVADTSNNRVQKFDTGAIRVRGVAPTAGLIFRAVGVPAAASLTAAAVRLAVTSAGDDAELTIRAEASPASFSEATPYDLSGRTKTTAGVDWVASGLWAERGADGYVTSPDISAVMQEVVDGAWTVGDDVALYLIDGASDLWFLGYDYGAGLLAAELFVEWADGVDPGLTGYGWPEDYWPLAYWSEYWPATAAAAGGSGAAVKFMYYQRQRRGR